MDAKCTIISANDRMCFNPRARDGREDTVIKEERDVRVSIHAPVMDANGVCWF